MRPKINFVIFTLAIGIVSFGFQCGKEDLIPVPENRFVEKLSLFPYKKTYQRGDTIWLQFQTASKTLFESLTNRVIPTDSTFMALNFLYQKRYPIPFNATVDTFCYTTTSFGLNQGLKIPPASRSDNFLTYFSDCNSNFYFFKVGFIPKTTGIYSLNWPAGELVDCPNKVLKSTYSIVNFRFDLADCNKDVYVSIPPASRGESVKGYTEKEIDNKKVFVFKVE
jgi:hypothetical protein